MITNETIEKVKQQVDLAVLVSETVSLQQRGGNLLGLCPFHSEKTPSFSVNPRENFYHCFGCGASGDALKYVMETRGLSFPEAIEFIADRLGIEVQRSGYAPKKNEIKDKHKLYKLNMDAHVFFKAALANAAPVITEYVASRGLAQETLTAFGVGYAPGGWRNLHAELIQRGYSSSDLVLAGLVRRNQKGDEYDSFRNRLIFPISMDGKRILGFGGRDVPGVEDAKDVPKYLNSAETPLYQKSKILYGYPQALSAMREAQTVYLVEGYMDVVSLWQAGVKNVVATCGTAITKQHIKRLAYSCSKLIVLFDGDSAGRTAAAKSFESALNTGIDTYALFLPDGEDPDTIARAHGANTDKYLAEQAKQPLFECFLDYLTREKGAETVAELDVAAKSSVLESVMELLGKVENRFEFDLFLGKAAKYFRVDRELLVSGKPKGKTSSAPTPAIPLKKEELLKTDTPGLKIEELPAFDRLLLHVVMAKKHSVCQEIMTDSNMCHVLHPVTLGFVEDVDHIFSDSDLAEDEQKELVKSLLQDKGPSWIQHWKKSYKMLEDPAVDMEKAFQECKRAFRRLSLKSALEQARVMMKSCSDEEKDVLGARIVKLSRELQESA